MGKERLNKYLASCGVCSRREADRLILEGRVTVNGKTAEVGEQVDGRDEILVNRKPVQDKNEKVVLAYHKPTGVTCTEKDRFAEKKITDMVKYPVRVTYAGRLDKEAHGLILLTNDGELIDAMMRGSAGHEKEYIVKVKAGRYCKEITEDFLAKMRAGVYLPELEITTKPCKIEKTGKFSFKIILTQGVNRQIRRMTRELGYHVETIKRTRVVNIRLGDLKPGEYRPLKGEELHELYHICMGH
ncbi:23S rRNA pseudouridine(2604) synthase [Lachnospiraceae bacterium]|nr:23S rRNA pseudouridine(2604) synthase [Lachnospiraceae bacterium]